MNNMAMKPTHIIGRIASILIVVAALLCSCAPSHRRIARPSASFQKPFIRQGYSVQVGAFLRIANAVHLTHKLQRQDIWAFYFKDASGLYKVRFGNFASRSAAIRKARDLRKQGIIGSYYIVNPEPLARILATEQGKERFRTRIVRTAYSFIGLPYRWGGNSPGRGFDCSGFTMAVYQLNGIVLPRSSYRQWRAGTPVSFHHLKKGDLVFFVTSSSGRVSHVGIYVGKNTFIHAPGRGKRIRVESLSNRYFRKHFAGARRYI